MSLIGKAAVQVSYIDGDFMYPIFKWSFITILISSISFCLYAFFITDLKYANHNTTCLWMTIVSGIVDCLKTYWWTWIVIPLMSSFTLAFVFAGICLEVTRWFIKDMVRQWFD